MKDWKKLSASKYNYKCVITNQKMECVHHLYSFTNIIKEAFALLNIEARQSMGEYTEEELSMIVEKTKEIQSKYPFGVPLTRRIHNLFHKTFGKQNNTPEQFEEFKLRIASGEIQI
jgi:hypothetical protein